ncbi:MAG TPA: hypothetical protein VHK69_06780 [Chitinophagaceae bacterium]|jgi:hypothetical protein|nr:hypothetical protein [Chitinophagaceae bacterium]
MSKRDSVTFLLLTAALTAAVCLWMGLRSLNEGRTAGAALEEACTQNLTARAGEGGLFIGSLLLFD